MNANHEQRGIWDSGDRQLVPLRPDAINHLPTKSQRPAAGDYDPRRYQWRFGRMPDAIRVCGDWEPNPFRKVGVFVVHGIGEQGDTDTAAALRWGVEDALEMIDPRTWSETTDRNENAWILPAPYIYDGNWAEYADLEKFRDDLRGDLDVLTSRQLKFFKNAWKDRTRGWLKSLGWITAQGIKLIVNSPGHKRVFYGLLTGLMAILVFAAGVFPRSRNFLTTYVNDARLYFEPKGDFEHEMVQLIDRRVGRAFLKMLGLNWELEDLAPDESLVIGGSPHRFDSVVWVAHSLGTVISFNVIGDILRRCEGIRHAAEREKTPSNERRLENARRVEQSIKNFITMGSPIDKVWFLYKSKDGSSNSVLRRWPEEYLPGGKLDLFSSKDWWTNFFYGSDPVSGPLDSITAFVNGTTDKKLIRNVSTARFHLPAASHGSYWRDVGVVSTILENAFSGFTKPVIHRFFDRSDPAQERLFVRSWPVWLHNWLSSFGLLLITLSAAGLIVFGITADQWVLPWI